MRKMFFVTIEVVCLGVFGLMGGCISVPSASQSPDKTEFPTVSKPIATTPSSIEITAAPRVTKTFPPSVTPTNTSTSIPTATVTITPTPVPTLDKMESSKLIREYLRTNASCLLPCVWGLTPGESSWQQAHDLMTYLGLQVESSSAGTPGEYSVTFDLENGPVIHGGMGFLEKDGIVQVIQLGTGDITQSPYYDLRNVIKDLGAPDYVGIDLRIGGQRGDPKVLSVGITIAYEEDMQTPWPKTPWAIFNYEGGAFKIGNHYRFCPTNLFLKGLVAEDKTAWLPRGFYLQLQSPESPLSIEELGGMSTPPRIESATGVSLEEFYRQIMDGGEPACFDTPIEFWPNR